MSHSLEQAIKKTRWQARRKRPWRLAAFQVVATLVQEFQLTAAFLQELAALDLTTLINRSKQASPCQPWLFPLLPMAQYEVARALLAHYDNPYLPYSRNPWEIRISGELARLQPDLSPALLESHSLTTIFQELNRDDHVRQHVGNIAGPDF